METDFGAIYIGVILNCLTGELASAGGSREWRSWPKAIGIGLDWANTETNFMHCYFYLYIKGNLGLVRGVVRSNAQQTSSNTLAHNSNGLQGNIVGDGATYVSRVVVRDQQSTTTGAKLVYNNQFYQMVGIQLPPEDPPPFYGLQATAFNFNLLDHRPNILMYVTRADFKGYYDDAWDTSVAPIQPRAVGEEISLVTLEE
jgi:hypothetical protein